MSERDKRVKAFEKLMVGMPAPGDSGRCSLRCYRSGTVGGNP